MSATRPFVHTDRVRALSSAAAKQPPQWSSHGVAVVLLLTVSCGAEPSLSSSGGPSVEHEAATMGSERSDAGYPPDPESTGASTSEVQAPGVQVLPYPKPPYGTQQGAIMADLAFMGWRNPSASSHDITTTETIRLSDFYDPEGTKGVEYILLNAVAVWCSVCRLEYEELERDGVYATYSARGLEVVGVLFEDNDGEPPSYVDLSNWSARYDVTFPFVTDPGFKTGVYFDRDATPMNMLIDARTMEIVLTMTGYNPAIYEQVNKLLTARGR